MIADHVFAPIVLDACNPGPMTGAGNHTYLLTSGTAPPFSSTPASASRIIWSRSSARYLRTRVARGRAG